MEIFSGLGVFLAVLFGSLNTYDKNLNKKDKVILAGIGAFIIIFCSILNIEKFSLLICFFSLVLYIFIFNKKNLKLILPFVLFCFIINILDVIQGVILVNFFKINTDILLKSPVVQGLMVFNLFIGVILISKLWREIVIKNSKLQFEMVNFSKKNKSMLVCIMLFTLITVSLINLLFKSTVLSNTRMFNYLSYILGIFFIISLSSCYMIVLATKKEYYMKFKEKEVESLKLYIKELEVLNTDIRKFRHDYINMLATMGGYIHENDFDNLKEFFDKNIVPLGADMSKKNLRIGLLQNVEVFELKGLLISKIINAQENGIEVFVDIAEKIKRVDIDIIKLARVIGILMDNAVEAAIESNEKFINICIFEKGKTLNIIVENSYGENEIPLYKIFEEGYSSKGANRGLGLSILRETIDKVPNATIETIVDNIKFIQRLEIIKSE